MPPAAVPHVDGRQHDPLPLRDFDTTGEGALPPETHSGIDQTLVLLVTRHDNPKAWLRAGEALHHVLLHLTTLGWVAGPMTQPIEVPLTRTQLRSAIACDMHPQNLLRVGLAPLTTRTPRRRHDAVIDDHTRPPEWAAVPPAGGADRRPAPPPTGRPVTDGRGGTAGI